MRDSIERHEELYAHTCESLADSIRRGEFPEANVPKHIEDLRQELTQCLGLNLITEGFYDRMDAMLASLLSRRAA
jgi:hypothetical protein